MRVAVVGAGVIGLTAAIRLREAGHDVSIHAERITPHTVASDRAAAIFYPWKVADQRARIWTAEAHAELSRLANQADPVVLHRELVQYFDEPLDALPWWAEMMPASALLHASECPAPFAGGMRVRTLVIDVPRYMPALQRRAVDELGCRIVAERVERLGDLGGKASLVINCAGLDGGRLAGEPGAMVPRAGHTVRVSALPAGSPCVAHELDARELTYVIPRSADCLLGGTDHPDDASLTPDPRITERIVARCGRLVPEIRSARVLEVRVGVRPGRRDGSVRLDGPEHCDGVPVIHCYGHGGSGHTLAWGCALEIERRVAAAG